MSILKRGAKGATVRMLQTLLKRKGFTVKVDGSLDAETEKALEDFKKTENLPAGGEVNAEVIDALNTNPAPEVRTETWDSHTNRRIKLLHPKIQAISIQFINALEDELGRKMRVTSGFRSIAEQEQLYAQGRTAPGNVVTQVKGGRSYHNYGLAIDIVEIKDGQPIWNNPDWESIAKIGEDMGFEWGGRWTSFVDKPHFQMTFEKKTSDLLALYNSGQRDGEYVTLI